MLGSVAAVALAARGHGCAPLLPLTLLLPGVAAYDDVRGTDIGTQAPYDGTEVFPSSSSSSSSSSSGLTGSGFGIDGVGVTADDVAWDFWGILVGQMATFAPPPPLAKCLGATLAGSLFALMGMFVEGLRDRGKKKAQAIASEAALKSSSEQAPRQRRGSAAPSKASAAGASGSTSCGSGSDSGSGTNGSASCGGAIASRMSSQRSTQAASSPPSRLASVTSGEDDEPQQSAGHLQRRARAVAILCGTGSGSERGANGAGSSTAASPQDPPDRRRLPLSPPSVSKNQAASNPGRSVPASSSSATASASATVAGIGTISGRPRFGADLTEVQKAERQIKCILNKLTRERFDKLYAQLLECFATQTSEFREQVVGVVAREVFAKATMEHSFVEMYADVCSKLSEDLGRQNGVQVNFRHALLDQCQRSFNLHLDPPRIDGDLDYEERYEELVKYKTRMLGNVRLIGQLLKRRMLSAKIIFHVTDELVSIGSPEALETLAVFLQTIGSTFDTPRWQGHARLEGVFLRAELFAEDSRQCSRTRCLLKDLLDKRKNAWREDDNQIVVSPERGQESSPKRGPESSPSIKPVQKEQSGSWRNSDWRDATKDNKAGPGSPPAGRAKPKSSS